MAEDKNSPTSAAAAHRPSGTWLHERLDGPHHHLLLSTPDDLDVRGYDGLVTVHHLPQEVLGAQAVLVRPDGYIGFRGPVAHLHAYLRRWLTP